MGFVKGLEMGEWEKIITKRCQIYSEKKCNDGFSVLGEEEKGTPRLKGKEGMLLSLIIGDKSIQNISCSGGLMRVWKVC